MSEVSFPPELYAELSQHTLNLSDRNHLGTAALAAGHVVTGFTAFEQFNAVEDQICSQLSPVERESDLPGITVEPTIAQKRIATILRPDGFNGRLRNGFAVILPFTAAQAARCDTRASSDVAAAKLTDERTGLRVVYCAELMLARAGLLKMTRNSLYYHRYASMLSVYKGMAQGGLRRVVQPDPELQRQVNLSISASTARTARALGRAVRNPARG